MSAVAGAFLGQRAIVHLQLFLEGRPPIVELVAEGVHVAQESQGSVDIPSQRGDKEKPHPRRCRDHVVAGGVSSTAPKNLTVYGPTV